jgi:transcriptional regulator with XRE-family HTH domain
MNKANKLRNQKSVEYIEKLKADKNLQDFARRLRYWRKKKKISQIDLSLSCKFNKNKIQEIESLYTSVTINDTYKICDALNIPVPVLFTDNEVIISQLITEFKA